MKEPFLPTVSTLRCAACWLRPLVLVAVFGLVPDLHGQTLAKTTEVTEDISSDGSVRLGFQMTFDAAPWRQWKTMVGDEPARLRAYLRHQFAAYTLENFKLERDDMNRVATVSVHSPVGPQLRDDGSFQATVDGYYHLINNAGNVWYFSGNNPRAGNSLNSIRITLPANAVNASVVNPNSPDQALTFGLTPPRTVSLWFYVAGAALLLLGGALALVALLVQPAAAARPLPAAPRALPTPPVRAEAPIIDVPPVRVDPASAAAVAPSRPTARPEQPGLHQAHRDDANVYSEPD